MLEHVIASLTRERDSLRSKLAECERDIEEASGTASDEFKALTVAEKLLALPPETDDSALVKGLIPPATLGVIYARGGVGKSTLIAQLASCLAAGKDFLSYRVPKQRRVLFLEAEGAPVPFLRRVQTMRRCLGLTSFPSMLVHPPGFTDFVFDSPALARLIGHAKPDLVVCDTLGHFWPHDENDAGLWKLKALLPMKRIVAATGTGFLIIHHATKSDHIASRNTNDGDDALWRGTSAIYDDVDYVLKLTGQITSAMTERRFLRVTKNRFGLMGTVDDLTLDKGSAVFRLTAREPGRE